MVIKHEMFAANPEAVVFCSMKSLIGPYGLQLHPMAKVSVYGNVEDHTVHSLLVRIFDDYRDGNRAMVQVFNSENMGLPKTELYEQIKAEILEGDVIHAFRANMGRVVVRSHADHILSVTWTHSGMSILIRKA